MKLYKIPETEANNFRYNVKTGQYCFVYLKDATWNNKSGYKLFDDTVNPCCRDYDAVIVPLAKTRGGKYLICREYHHDKPAGHYSVFISLTLNEVTVPNIDKKCIKLANEVVEEYISL